MTLTRRTVLRTSLAALGATQIMPFAARAAAGEGDMYKTDAGEIGIHPVSHASFVMTTPSGVIWNDPVGEAAAYEGLPRPDLILITHHHGDHYSEDTLKAVAGDAQIITNPTVYEQLSEGLKANAVQVANGESVDSAIGITVEAVPAYNTTEDRLKYHPQGRDNGYVMNIDGTTVYIAGDTEGVPEMRALTGIDIAFVPMNLPYTMTVEQAAAAVSEFKPKVVYPYHYRDSDPMEFEKLVGEATDATQVVQGPWYG